jgi:hypothetical protein
MTHCNEPTNFLELPTTQQQSSFFTTLCPLSSNANQSLTTFWETLIGSGMTPNPYHPRQRFARQENRMEMDLCNSKAMAPNKSTNRT